MPVLKNFMVSHQWLREPGSAAAAARCARARIPDGETGKLMGYYSKEQVQVTAARAAHAIMHADDPLGMQIVVPRNIAPKEIHAVRSVPQVVGWRYFPGARCAQGLRMPLLPVPRRDCRASSAKSSRQANA